MIVTWQTCIVTYLGTVKVWASHKMVTLCSLFWSCMTLSYVGWISMFQVSDLFCISLKVQWSKVPLTLFELQGDWKFMPWLNIYRFSKDFLSFTSKYPACVAMPLKERKCLCFNSVYWSAFGYTIFFVFPSGAYTVSYTHLDVYKRQEIMSEYHK